MQHLSEEQWIQVSHAVEFRPPMPWFVLREMTEQDLRAVYRFIRNLGPAGEPAPSYIPPDQEPPKPYILFPYVIRRRRNKKHLLPSRSRGTTPNRAHTSPQPCTGAETSHRCSALTYDPVISKRKQLTLCQLCTTDFSYRRPGHREKSRA